MTTTSKGKKDSRSGEDENSTQSTATGSSETNPGTAGNEAATPAASSGDRNGLGDKEKSPEIDAEQKNDVVRTDNRDKRRYDPQDQDRSWHSPQSSRGSSQNDRYRDQDEQGYSRNWDTLNNDQYGQLTQGSYNPRNNTGFRDEDDDGYRPSRGGRNQDYGREQNDNRYRDASRDRSPGYGRQEPYGNSYRSGDDQWGQREGRGPGFSARGRDNEDYGRRDRMEPRSSAPGNQQRDASYPDHHRNPDNYNERRRQPDDERYGSHWHTGQQDIYRNQGGQYSDYENPPFDRDEFGGSARERGNARQGLSRQYENFGSEYDNQFEQGNRMNDDSYYRDQPARERGWNRGYQYGNDTYNSGTNRDNPRRGEERRWTSGNYNDDYRDGGPRSHRHEGSYREEGYDDRDMGSRGGRRDEGEWQERHRRSGGSRRRN